MLGYVGSLHPTGTLLKGTVTVKRNDLTGVDVSLEGGLTGSWEYLRLTKRVVLKIMAYCITAPTVYLGVPKWNPSFGNYPNG